MYKNPKIKFVILLAIILFNVYITPCLALKIQNAGDYINTSAQEAGLETNLTFADIAVRIVQAVLGIVGIVFFLLIIYGGYTWMTAEGNDEKVGKAKKIITSAVIGLAIVTAAYSISYFIASLLEVTPPTP